MTFEQFPEPVRPALADLVGRLQTMNLGQWALGCAGSLGRGTWDPGSDLDFRLYTSQPAPPLSDPFWAEYLAAEQAWRDRGIGLDHIAATSLPFIDRWIDEWMTGTVEPHQEVWTIWGYHLLPDMATQAILHDPDGILAGWKAKLATFPEAFRAAVLARHLERLRYWRQDYHYRHKVDIGDPVFLAGLTSRLVHDVLQVLFALNRRYYPGDGNNLKLAASLPCQPNDLAARITAILYPGSAAFTSQRDQLFTLIDDTLALADQDTA